MTKRFIQKILCCALIIVANGVATRANSQEPIAKDVSTQALRRIQNKYSLQCMWPGLIVDDGTKIREEQCDHLEPRQQWDVVNMGTCPSNRWCAGQPIYKLRTEATYNKCAAIPTGSGENYDGQPAIVYQCISTYWDQYWVRTWIPLHATPGGGSAGPGYQYRNVVTGRCLVAYWWDADSLIKQHSCNPDWNDQIWNEGS